LTEITPQTIKQLASEQNISTTHLCEVLAGAKHINHVIGKEPLVSECVQCLL